jgi:beta-lactamase superfamily II metal-dependent hydrolase
MRLLLALLTALLLAGPAQATHSSVRVQIIDRGQADGILIRTPNEENNNSIVVRMEFGSFSMLFAGDAETEEGEWLMEHHPDQLDVEVLKASHHGAINGVDGQIRVTGENGDEDVRSWLDVVSPMTWSSLLGVATPMGILIPLP